MSMQGLNFINNLHLEEISGVETNFCLVYLLRLLIFPGRGNVPPPQLPLQPIVPKPCLLPPSC